MTRTIGLGALFTLLAWSTVGSGDTLLRRGFLGVRFDPIPEALHATIGPSSGLIVGDVLPGSAADHGGLKPGDVVLQADGVKDGATIMAQLDRRRERETVNLRVLRNGKPLDIAVQLTPRPRESHGLNEVIYSDVVVGDHLQRLIVTKPAGGSTYPALFYVSGMSCDSLDLPGATEHPVRSFIDGLTRAGIVTVRLEPSGVGDSQGPPCQDVDFEAEVRAHREAVKWIDRLPFVEPGNVFLFGHGLGGVVVPLIANESVRGSIVYGTMGHTWAEYEIQNGRRQLALAGTDPATIEDTIRGMQTVSARVLFDDWTMQRLAASFPELTALHNGAIRYNGRDPQFFRQLQSVNIARAWAAVSHPVLALWGGSDFIADRTDLAAVVDAINAAHPGHATLETLDGVDHVFSTFSTREESYAANMRGSFNPVVVHRVVDWMQSKRVLQGMQPGE